jgi:hypothetical protein
MPVLCEDSNVPYVFVPSKEQLGEASSTKRPTSVTMIVFGGKNKDVKAAADYKELYDECYAQAKDLVSLKHSIYCKASILTESIINRMRSSFIKSYNHFSFFFCYDLVSFPFASC